MNKLHLKLKNIKKQHSKNKDKTELREQEEKWDRKPLFFIRSPVVLFAFLN